MPLLAQSIPATLIHGVTGREVATCVLDAGTEYRLEWTNRYQLENERLALILVPGTPRADGTRPLYRYRVAARHLS